MIVDKKLLETYHDTAVRTILEKHIKQLDQDYHQNKAVYFQEMYDLVKPYYEKERDNRKAILCISWLRNSYIQGKELEYCLGFFGQDWYGDRNRQEYFVRFEWLQAYIDNYCQELRAETEKSFPYVPDTVIQNECLYGFSFFQQYVKEVWRAGLRNKTVDMKIYIGEYHGQTEQIYAPLAPVKVEAGQLLENPAKYAYQQVAGIQADHIDFSELNLSCITFTECEFYNCSFRYSTLAGTAFRECKMINCNFELAHMPDAMFVDSYLERCCFRLVEADISTGTAQIPSFHGVMFVNTQVKQCDFRYAHLLGADFSSADLEDSIFMEEQKERARFQEAQVEAVRWETSGGGRDAVL